MGPEELLDVLQDLRDDEFKTFKWFLKMPEGLDGYQPLKECQLENADRVETVDLMLKAYRLDGALKVTRKVLEKMNRKDLVQKLPGTSSAPEANSTEVQMSPEAAAAVVAPHRRQEAPSLQQQIISAVAESRERRGLSQPALNQILAAKGVDVAKSNNNINIATLNMVRDGTLTQIKGSGASVSFKLPKEPKAAKHVKKMAKKTPTKVKNPVTKKTAAKKLPANKPAVAKKVAAQKKAQKKAPVKKPAAKKPAAKKPAAKKPAPKKPAAKKPAAKKPAAKKPAAKKAKK